MCGLCGLWGEVGVGASQDAEGSDLDANVFADLAHTEGLDVWASGQEGLFKMDALDGDLACGAKEADEVDAKKDGMLRRTIVDHDANMGRLKSGDAPLKPRETLIGLGFAVLSGLDRDSFDQDVVAVNGHRVVECLCALRLEGAGGHTHPRLL